MAMAARVTAVLARIVECREADGPSQGRDSIRGKTELCPLHLPGAFPVHVHVTPLLGAED